MLITTALPTLIFLKPKPFRVLRIHILVKLFPFSNRGFRGFRLFISVSFTAVNTYYGHITQHLDGNHVVVVAAVNTPIVIRFEIRVNRPRETRTR